MAGPTNRQNWYAGSPEITHAHELSHQMGLLDEYEDVTVKDRKTYTDHSIMGDYYNEGAAEAAVKPRHGERLASIIAGATGKELKSRPRRCGRRDPARVREPEDCGMNVWTHDRWRFPLPEAHKFPITKYGLLRERLLADGLCTADEVHEAEPVGWDALGHVHDAALLERIRTGTMGLRESRALGLPWSPELVERGRRSTTGTLLAAREALRLGVAMNLGGGTHHAGRDFSRGYCLFNDVALALDVLRREGAVRRAVVVDCDVHQGDGTAHLLGPDPDAFTLSLHGARNYPFQRIPSDLDVDLPTGTDDEGYLAALRPALGEALSGGPYDIAFYLAGADPWEGDRLGRLALTKEGLRRRDALVLDTLRDADLPVCVVLAGGYAPDVRDTVDINAATAAEIATRL